MRHIFRVIRAKFQSDTNFIVASVVIGATLRAFHLGTQSLWLDELFSVAVARRDWTQMVIGTIEGDTNPPLFNLLLHVAVHFGSDEATVRFVSLLFGVATIPLFYRLARALFDAPAARVATMVLALNPVAEKVSELLEPHIERQGYELVSIEFRRGTRSSMLRLLVDKPGGGIALDDLERLSPILSDLLDVYDPVEGRYTLEVASPGINRPLSKLAHFEAHRGQRVKIRTHRARDGRKSFIGTLVSVGPAGVELDDEPSRRVVAIGFDEMESANYDYDFGDRERGAARPNPHR